MSLVASFLALVQPLSWVWTAPSFQSFLDLLPGWLFARRRTLTGVLVAAGALGKKHFSSYHRLFAQARWSLDQLGFALFRLVLPFLRDAVVDLVLDDTLARKRGKKVWGAGMHHDPLISSKKTALVNWGHSWVVLAVAVRFPFLPNKVFSLPLLFRLYLNQKAAKRWRVAYRTRPQLAVELLQTLCGYFSEHHFHARADSTYGGQSVLKFLPKNCDLTSRLALDARLHEAPPARKPGTPGRPRKRGARLPSPEQMLKGRARRHTLDIYGRRDRVRLVEAEARWYSVPDRPLKIVAVEPLSGGRTVQAFYSTCTQLSGEQLLVGYSGRWSIEESNQGSKSHLGFEEPQGWSRWAVLRTAPMAMVMYSLVVLWFAKEGHRLYRVEERPWYPTKTAPSFADMLATLKRQSLQEEISALVEAGHLRKKLLRVLSVAAQVGP